MKLGLAVVVLAGAPSSSSASDAETKTAALLSSSLNSNQPAPPHEEEDQHSPGLLSSSSHAGPNRRVEGEGRINQERRGTASSAGRKKPVLDAADHTTKSLHFQQGPFDRSRKRQRSIPNIYRHQPSLVKGANDEPRTLKNNNKVDGKMISNDSSSEREQQPCDPHLGILCQDCNVTTLLQNQEQERRSLIHDGCPFSFRPSSLAEFTLHQEHTNQQSKDDDSFHFTPQQDFKPQQEAEDQEQKHVEHGEDLSRRASETKKKPRLSLKECIPDVGILDEEEEEEEAESTPSPSSSPCGGANSQCLPDDTSSLGGLCVIQNPNEKERFSQQSRRRNRRRHLIEQDRYDTCTIPPPTESEPNSSSSTYTCSNYGCRYGVCANTTVTFRLDSSTGQPDYIQKCLELRQQPSDFLLFPEEDDDEQPRVVCTTTDYDDQTCSIDINGVTCDSCQLYVNSYYSSFTCQSFDCRNTVSETYGSTCYGEKNDKFVDPLYAQYQSDESYYYDVYSDFVSLCLLDDKFDNNYNNLVLDCDCSTIDPVTQTGTAQCRYVGKLCTYPDAATGQVTCATLDYNFEFLEGSLVPGDNHPCLTFLSQEDDDDTPETVICADFSQYQGVCEYTLNGSSCGVMAYDVTNQCCPFDCTNFVGGNVGTTCNPDSPRAFDLLDDFLQKLRGDCGEDHDHEDDKFPQLEELCAQPTCDCAQVNRATGTGYSYCLDVICNQNDNSFCAYTAQVGLFFAGTMYLELDCLLSYDTNDSSLYDEYLVCYDKNFFYNTCSAVVNDKDCTSCKLITDECVQFDCRNIPQGRGNQGNSCYEGDYAHDHFEALSKPVGPWKYCDYEDNYYTQHCSCDEFDSSKYSGTITCTRFQDYCHPVSRVCSTNATSVYTIQEGTVVSTQDCLYLFHPILQSVCLSLDPAATSPPGDCTMTIDGTECQQCLYSNSKDGCIEFDCRNVVQDIAGTHNNGTTCEDQFPTDEVAQFYVVDGTMQYDMAWYDLCYGDGSAYCDCVTSFNVTTATGTISCLAPNYCLDDEEVCGQVSQIYTVDRYGSYQHDRCYSNFSSSEDVEVCYQYDNNHHHDDNSIEESNFSCTVNSVKCHSCRRYVSSSACGDGVYVSSFDCTNTELGTFFLGLEETNSNVDVKNCARIHPVFGFVSDTRSPSAQPSSAMTQSPTAEMVSRTLPSEAPSSLQDSTVSSVSPSSLLGTLSCLLLSAHFIMR